MRRNAVATATLLLLASCEREVPRETAGDTRIAAAEARAVADTDAALRDQAETRLAAPLARAAQTPPQQPGEPGTN